MTLSPPGGTEIRNGSVRLVYLDRVLWLLMMPTRREG